MLCCSREGVGPDPRWGLATLRWPGLQRAGREVCVLHSKAHLAVTTTACRMRAGEEAGLLSRLAQVLVGSQQALEVGSPQRHRCGGSACGWCSSTVQSEGRRGWAGGWLVREVAVGKPSAGACWAAKLSSASAQPPTLLLVSGSNPARQLTVHDQQRQQGAAGVHRMEWQAICTRGTQAAGRQAASVGALHVPGCAAASLLLCCSASD